jgi:hypothetical protein
MPRNGDPQQVNVFPAQINIPVDPGLFITVQIQGDGSPEAAARIEPTQQDLIDYLQDWPGKLDRSDITGSFYECDLFLVNPTHMVPGDPPPDGLRAS